MKILQLPNIGNGGRLGNHLFTIASTIGLALRHGYTPRFPANWKYRNRFNIPDEWFGEIVNVTPLREAGYEYQEWPLYGEVVSISGYLQSPKYWAGFEDKIREYLTPKGCKPAIIDRTAVHYRRDDYVGNPNYYQLPMGYYLTDGEVMAFSDDNGFKCLHHYPAATRNEIEDLILMVSCNRHIISNSTFSWWGAYLSGSNDVTYPSKWFDGPLADRATTKDLFPDEWKEGDVNRKYDTMDVTFIIPFSYDHQDRAINIQLIISFIVAHFDTNIICGEINTNSLDGFAMNFDFNGIFHRTRALNEMTKAATTPFVINWDSDVLCSPWQIVKMIQALRNGDEIVYPYDGPMTMVPKEYTGLLQNDLTLVPLAGKGFKTAGATSARDVSFGGAFGFNKVAYMAIGGENENFISYGPEDQERFRRCNVMGLKVSRVKGTIYHIDHWRGDNSSFRHAAGRSNQRYWEQVRRFDRQQYLNHINSWKWLK